MAFLAAATLLILGRCAYRVDELSDGYHGPLIHDEATFIAFEGSFTLVAAFCLTLSNPGMAFAETSGIVGGVKDVEKGDSESASSA